MSEEIKNREGFLREKLSTTDLANAGNPPARAGVVGVPQIDSAPSAANTVIIPPAPGMPSGTPAGTAAAAARAKEEDRGPLFSPDEAAKFRAEWDNLQGTFVDDPRRAVESADQLVAATMKRLAEVFAEERQKMEHQWDCGDNVSTEDLRLALRRYRSFFGRLLSF